MDNLNVLFLLLSEPSYADKDMEGNWFGNELMQNQRFQSLIQRQKKSLTKK